jgi:hypothetical protein
MINACTIATAALTMLLAASAPALAQHNYQRPQDVHRAFRAANPCPSTGSTHGPCPEVADHFIPLCLGGPDDVSNLWWENLDRSLIKDGLEWEACRAMRQVEARGNDQDERDEVMKNYLADVRRMGGAEAEKAERTP